MPVGAGSTAAALLGNQHKVAVRQIDADQDHARQLPLRVHVVKRGRGKGELRPVVRPEEEQDRIPFPARRVIARQMDDKVHIVAEDDGRDGLSSSDGNDRKPGIRRDLAEGRYCQAVSQKQRQHHADNMVARSHEDSLLVNTNPATGVRRLSGGTVPFPHAAPSGESLFPSLPETRYRSQPYPDDGRVHTLHFCSKGLTRLCVLQKLSRTMKSSNGFLEGGSGHRSGIPTGVEQTIRYRSGMWKSFLATSGLMESVAYTVP